MWVEKVEQMREQIETMNRLVVEGKVCSDGTSMEFSKSIIFLLLKKDYFFRKKG